MTVTARNQLDQIRDAIAKLKADIDNPEHPMSHAKFAADPAAALKSVNLGPLEIILVMQELRMKWLLCMPAWFGEEITCLATKTCLGTTTPPKVY